MSRQGFVFGKILERRSGAAGLLGRDDRRQTRYPAEGVPLTSRSGEDSITDEGGRMLKLFLVMALMFLPLSVPYGILCFAAARWGLQRKTMRFRRGVRVCLLIGLALLAAGMAYGLLRYCGVLVFPDDDPSSIHPFNSSGGDEGFQYLYMCGTVFLGILAALRQERAAHPADPQKAADQHASDC